MAATKKLVVVGGAGALGRGIGAHFTRASAWKTLSVDFTANDDVDASFVFDRAASSTLTQASAVLQHIQTTYGKVDAVVCAAGGWAGGSIKDADTLVNLAQMHSRNTESAVMAAHLASHVLNPGGLLVLTGAAAALKATPGMVSYGISKAGTHHLIASSIDALPEDATALGVLPVTIDTPMNRKFMADADFASWTKVDAIGAKILEWSNASPSSRPPNGHLLTVLTNNNVDTWKDVGNPFL
ncbi:Dihydropteridine reductase, partial [Globisporangium splendens]